MIRIIKEVFKYLFYNSHHFIFKFFATGSSLTQYILKKIVFFLADNIIETSQLCSVKNYIVRLPSSV